MKRKLLPFWLMPGSWGLKGKTKEIAKAEYELEGIDLEIRLLQIECPDATSLNKFNLGMLSIKKKYGLIDEYEEKVETIRIEDPEHFDIKKLGVDYDFGKITKREYEKSKCNMLKLPWLDILNINVDETDPNFGSMEFDWNEHFIEKLEKDGFIGKTDEETVDLWFVELCKNVALEEIRQELEDKEIDEDQVSINHIKRKDLGDKKEFR